jgi:hypothetical protein
LTLHRTFVFDRILVTPGVRADCVPGGRHLLENCGLIGGMQADREENRLGAVCGEGGEHRLRILGPGAIVEGEHYLAFAQETWLLKCSNPKPGPPVVSISTTRAIPKALAFEHEDGAKAGQGEGGEPCAKSVGARVPGACMAAICATVRAAPDACPSIDATMAGPGDRPETDLS